MTPFSSIFEIARSQPLSTSALQLGGNILLLLPLGFLLPLLFDRFERPGAVVVAGLSVSLGIELVQVLTSSVLGFTYKVFDVDDLILNTIGVVVGWVLWRIVVLALGPTVLNSFRLSRTYRRRGHRTADSATFES